MPANFSINFSSNVGKAPVKLVASYTCRESLIIGTAVALANHMSMAFRDNIDKETAKTLSTFCNVFPETRMWNILSVGNIKNVKAQISCSSRRSRELVMRIFPHIANRYNSNIHVTAVNTDSGFCCITEPHIIIESETVDAFAAMWWCILLDRLLHDNPHSYVDDVNEIINNSNEQNRLLWYYGTDKALHTYLWNNRDAEWDADWWFLSDSGPCSFTARDRNKYVYDIYNSEMMQSLKRTGLLSHIVETLQLNTLQIEE